MDFYRTNEVLPASIQRAFRLKDDYLVTVQSANDFYKQLERHSSHGFKSSNQIGKVCTQSKGKVTVQRAANFDNQSSESIVYLRDLDLSIQHVPNCRDFIVYIFKKRNQARVLRFYQCRCDLSQKAGHCDRLPNYCSKKLDSSQ